MTKKIVDNQVEKPPPFRHCRRGRIVGIVAVLVALGAGAAVYTLLDPGGERWLLKCPFYAFTGYKCPGCGSQRMMHSLLTGNFVAAWRYNALLVIMLPVVAAYVAGAIMPRRLARLNDAINSPALLTAILIIIVIWWIVRNIFGW